MKYASILLLVVFSIVTVQADTLNNLDPALQ